MRAFWSFSLRKRNTRRRNNSSATIASSFRGTRYFPVRANAMVQYRQGSVHEGLSVYEQSFQPVWDPQLVKSYFDLLRDTKNLRKFRDDAHAALVANPQDLTATARLFYYYQQQGKTEVAQQAIADYRAHKESGKSRGLLRNFTSARDSSRTFTRIPNPRAITLPSTTAKICPTRRRPRLPVSSGFC